MRSECLRAFVCVPSLLPILLELLCVQVLFSLLGSVEQSSSLFGWLARERYSGRHALRPRLRTRSGRLLPAPRCRGCPVSGMEALSRSEARVLAWRYLESHARTRHSTARPLLPGLQGSHSEAAGQSADQIYAATVDS